ncbi:salicylate synthase [Streptosporangium sp. NBC_01755]|uniref:salicylate synthase n=1 Tax=unclassified Streptosporangium TaxID=2632669 RepID=UPI002DD7C484|nr:MULTISPECIES: salicylate synthase [unclassified Streptosporangium]WSA28855.1 salicylate synthase [Streptosporangium sp. NBC_01810]WSC99699.1 salicylate synthase [Streptosporangium sp. NBC_01755]
MSFGISTDEMRAEVVVDSTVDPLHLVARLAGSGLFDDYTVYERPGLWTFAGGVSGEVILESGVVRSRWLDGPSVDEAWSGRPAAALKAVFGAAPWPAWNAYGWIAFEFAATGPAGRLAHLVVPRTEVHIEAGRALVVSADTGEAERVAELLAAPGAPRIAAPSPVDVRSDGDHYRSRVAQAISEITAGLYQKVIVSRRLPIPFPVDVVATYVCGRAANTPARSFLLDLDGFQATGFSPEVLVGVDGRGTVTTQPLAGTRAFGRGESTDSRTRHELESDPKEIFEHAVSVRTSQQELYQVCAPDTVRVTGFMAVKERGSVQHLGSSVSGELAPGRTCWDALDALFPGVTASGIPKPEAIDAITRLEERRGLYSGAVLTVSRDGAMDAALVLRALYSENGRAWLRAGAGIVSASTPEREYEETCEKLSSIAPYVVQRA